MPVVFIDRRLSAASLLFVLTAGCTPDGTGAPAPVPVPSEAYRLTADGTVPWVDEPVKSLSAQHTPPTVAPDSPHCRAEQLTGGLDRWWQPQPGAGGSAGTSPRRQPPGGWLIGEVVVTNVAGPDCVLRGVPEIRLFSGGAQVPTEPAGSVDDAAAGRAVPVPAGGTAVLRVEWAGPYCAAARPPFELRIRLAEKSGELRAPVRPTDHPACSGTGARRANLSAGAFTTPASTDPQTAVRSPLWPLTAEVSGPASARPGERITYTVTLRNPGDAAVTLLPCPGYHQEVRASTAGVYDDSSARLYRLNCRPTTGIAARGELRFAMVATVPGKARPGGEVTVTWSLRTPQRLPSGHLVGVLRLAVTG